MNTKQSFESPDKGGFSDVRLRLFIFAFMTVGLLLAPVLGMLAAFGIVMLFGFFIAVKIARFQSTNLKSNLLYRQAMDRLYNNSQNAELISRQLKELDEKEARRKANTTSRSTQTIKSERIVWGVSS